MAALCEGRVCIVTGAGGGIGREHALLLAAHGANVVVNDIGGAVDGTGASEGPANSVVHEIVAAGGTAVANADDVSSWDGAERLVQQAIDEFVQLDVLVNNAGILRDRMLVNMTDDEWDAVIKVHLRGTFGPTRWSAAYWREQAKGGEANDARIINTSSPSGIYGNPGQTNYGAAKGGIASFTIIAAMELARYGVTVNAIAPVALTRMTAGLGGATQLPERKPDEFDAMAPENISPLVVWLGSPGSKDVTGRVFNVGGGRISVAESWVAGPGVDKGDRWSPAELDDVVPKLVAEAAGPSNMAGQRQS